MPRLRRLLLIGALIQCSSVRGFSGAFSGGKATLLPRSWHESSFARGSTRQSSFHLQVSATSDNDSVEDSSTIWEQLAQMFVSENYAKNPTELRNYVQYITMLRVGVPAVGVASAACLLYPSVSMMLAGVIDDSRAFEVISQDYSQYIQNILTTCGLMFSILVGYTYYFLYSQQEQIYLALFEEVTVAKSLLEQVSLVSEGRRSFYQTILHCIDRYVRNDLTQLDEEPAILLSSRPIDDPLEDIMYLTSVGEPSVVYQTVRALRQARAHRLGALQRKLPKIHFILLVTLACIVLSSFPVLGAGVQTIGGPGILSVQSWYLSFIVFGICVCLGVINELNQPSGNGAYNVMTVMSIMVAGLEEELEGRLADKYVSRALSPSNDVTIPLSMQEEEESPTVTTASGEADDDKVSLSHNGEVDKTESSPWIGKRIANRIRNRRQ